MPSRARLERPVGLPTHPSAGYPAAQPLQAPARHPQPPLGQPSPQVHRPRTPPSKTKAKAADTRICPSQGLLHLRPDVSPNAPERVTTIQIQTTLTSHLTCTDAASPAPATMNHHASLDLRVRRLGVRVAGGTKPGLFKLWPDRTAAEGTCTARRSTKSSAPCTINHCLKLIREETIEPSMVRQPKMKWIRPTENC